jgi:ketosteroid isomerase-like protein
MVLFDSKPQTGSIFSRNRDDALEAETLLWRAMCDGKPKSLKKYMTEDCIVAEPDENKLISKKSEPNLDEYLENFRAWTAYKMHDEPEFVEIDMMSSALTYKVTAWRQDDRGKMHGTEALCSSVWRQGPGGDWRCCMHHMTKIGK